MLSMSSHPLPPHANGYMNSNSNEKADEDRASQVGVAFTTSDVAGTSTPSFDQQYLEQQQAYQRSMQEHHPDRHYLGQDNQSDTAGGSHSSLGLQSSNTSQDISPLSGPQSYMPTQNRVFGLTKNLNGPSVETAHLEERARGRGSQESLSSLVDAHSRHSHPPSGVLSSATNNGAASTSDSAAKGNDGPQFSVEVVAPSFDQRGYPVFSGRGARIRGFLRTRPLQGGEILITLFAEISQGSPAAVFGGVALMPPEQGDARRVFTIEERIPLHDSMASLKPGADPSSNNPDDYIYTVPFDVHLPLGVATRFVNGEQTTTAVALPPSYEMSSKNDGKEKESAKASNLLRSSAASIKSKSSRMTNFSTSAAGIGNSVKDAVEKGLGEVYRIGCFYKISFTLQKPPIAAPVDSSRRLRLGKKKKVIESPTILDKVTVPFIFTGEPSNLPPPPHSIPLSLVAPALLNQGMDLGPQWACESTQAKWSGNFFRTAKRQVQLEMHMPRPAVLQAPCVFPIIIVIRPMDPTLLASLPCSAGLGMDSALDTDTIHGYTHSPLSAGSRATSRVTTANGEREVHSSNDTAMDHSGLVQKLKHSMTLNHRSSHSNLPSSPDTSRLHTPMESSSSSIRGSIASTFSRRRPNTAPSGISSDDNGSQTQIGIGGTYMGSLSGLVKVTLLRTTYCISSTPSDPPKARRRLISAAEMEEIDIETILNETNKAGTNGERGNLALMEADQALIQHVRSKGIRVLRGLIRVGTDAVPSFRCQGIEVKYAIKVDLVPFSKKENKQSSSGGGGGSGSQGAGAGTITPASRRSISLGDMPSSPPLPPFPAEHRSSMAASNASTSTRLHSQPHYSPSVALGLGVTGGGGTSTIVSESAMGGNRLGKGVGALWADVRMVRGNL